MFWATLTPAAVLAASLLLLGLPNFLTLTSLGLPSSYISTVPQGSFGSTPLAYKHLSSFGPSCNSSLCSLFFPWLTQGSSMKCRRSSSQTRRTSPFYLATSSRPYLYPEVQSQRLSLSGSLDTPLCNLISLTPGLGVLSPDDSHASCGVIFVRPAYPLNSLIFCIRLTPLTMQGSTSFHITLPNRSSTDSKTDSSPPFFPSP